MKVFIILMIITSTLFADSFSTKYDVKIGMFGKVGIANLHLETDGQKYEMRVKATLIGTAASLTGNRVETYISKGHITQGKYIPDTFTKIKQTTRQERIQVYTFDHKNKSVRLVNKHSKWISSTKFDTLAFKIIKQDLKETSQEESKLPEYKAQDVLSSYLNTVKTCNAQNKNYDLVAIGAHNDDTDVTLSFLEGLDRQAVASSFQKILVIFISYK
ncbi:MAG: hypothetical protein COA44_05080 [Arcobacter sp.]|nr:MAG: hypothetical protein COA44_05080 [Arcobacter sp.]